MNPYSREANEQNYQQAGLEYGGNNEAIRALRNILPWLSMGAQDQAKFGYQLQGQRQSAIMQLLNSLSPASQGAEQRRLQNQAYDSAGQGSRQASLALKSQGLGDGFNAGNTAAIFGDAARTSNDIAREYASPEHQANALLSWLQVADAGSQNPYANQLMDLNGAFSKWQELKDSASANRAATGGIGALAGAVGQYAGGINWTRPGRGAAGSNKTLTAG